MANKIVAWLYTTDKGNTLVTGINEELTTQTDGLGAVKIGGAKATDPAAYDPLPRGFKPRRAVMAASGKRNREVPIMTVTCPLATATSTTLDIEDSDGASTTYTLDHRKGEQFRKRRQQ